MSPSLPLSPTDARSQPEKKPKHFVFVSLAQQGGFPDIAWLDQLRMSCEAGVPVMGSGTSDSQCDLSGETGGPRNVSGCELSLVPRGV